MRATRPAHLIILDFVTVITFDEAYQVMKLLIMQSSPASSSLSDPNILLSTQFSNTHSICSFKQTSSAECILLFESLHYHSRASRIHIMLEGDITSLPGQQFQNYLNNVLEIWCCEGSTLHNIISRHIWKCSVFDIGGSLRK